MIPITVDEVAQDVPHSHQEEVYQSSSTSMVDDYNLIQDKMEIPKDEYKRALQFLERIQSLIPKCQLVWYRNWYLKLRSTTHLDELLIFVDQQGMQLLSGY